MIVTETERFRLSGLYPCSVACATRVTPCPACASTINENSSPVSLGTRPIPLTSACLMPRIPLRHIYVQFIQALRERLINDMIMVPESTATEQDPIHGPMRSAMRMKDGFLLGFPLSLSTGEWGTGWAYHATQRTLLSCRLHIDLEATRILVQPILRPTWYLPLSAVLPLPPGAPIVLLPHGAPAYYLNTYTGPVGGLTVQFQRSLFGLGVGDWSTLR